MINRKINILIFSQLNCRLLGSNPEIPLFIYFSCFIVAQNLNT